MMLTMLKIYIRMDMNLEVGGRHYCLADFRTQVLFLHENAVEGTCQFLQVGLLFLGLDVLIFLFFLPIHHII